MKPFKLLALSGSLRRNSCNAAAIRALQMLAPDHIHIDIGSIGNLPLFNPDRETEVIPEVDKLKSAVKRADGLIIASPEYAHGISGPMKNALDWLIGGTEFPYKPIMLINTSPRSRHAQDALKEVLFTMSGIVVEESSVSIPLLSSGLDAKGIVKNKNMADALLKGLSEFCRAIEEIKSG